MEAVYASPEFGIAGPWLAEYTLTGLNAGVMVFDASGCASQWNRTAAELLGVPEETLAGRRLDDPALELLGHHGRTLSAADDPIRRALAEAEPVRGTRFGVSAATGDVVWRTVDVLPIFGADRRPRAALATVVDRSSGGPNHSADWQLVTHALLHTDLTANVVVERSGTVVHWNERLLELTGWTHADMFGRHVTELCDIDLAWVHDQLDAEPVQPVGGITWAVRRDGSELAVIGRFTAVDWPYVGDAVVVQLLAASAFADVASGAPPHADERVFTHAHTPMLLVSPEGDIVGANRNALSLFGAHFVDLVGRPLTRRLAGLDPGTLRRAIAEADVTDATATLGTYFARAGNGDEAPVSTTVTMLGRPAGATSATALVQLTSLEPAAARGTDG